MGVIEDMKKYENYTLADLKTEIMVLLKELEMTKTQLVQMSKERNQLFDQKVNLKLPDVVIQQQQKAPPQPQGQPRQNPPQGVPQGGQPPVRPLPNQIPQR